MCVLFGHKNIVKANIGKTFTTINQFTTLPQIGHYYIYERKKFCLRCGINLPEIYWKLEENNIKEKQ